MNSLATVAGVEGRKRLLVLEALVGALWVGHPALALFVGAAVGLAVVPKLPAYFDRAGKLCLQTAIALGVVLWLLVLPVTWVAAMAW